MTYNKEKLLKMLSIAPLYEGMKFHEGKNDDFLASMGDDFYNNYDYEYGATKLALIPIDKKEDYVIKIPYTGCYNYESGYYINSSIYCSSKNYYWEYCEANDEERPWDYCKTELERYKIAIEEGLEKCFAKTELLGYINNYPIYIQERCTTLSSCRVNHKHERSEKIKTSNYCHNYYKIDMDWLTDFRLYYGEYTLLKFINFIQDMEWDDDLRSENIGYINNRPVLIDYSGFLD